MRREITLQNNTQELPRLVALIEALERDWAIPPEVAYALQLALEEVVVNAMHYAYPPGERGEITVRIERQEESICCTVEDAGIPFDPTRASAANIDLEAEERAIGGLGIHLARAVMDQMSYCRQEGRNQLKLIKKTIRE
ncbi:MAG: ATP-binding protein [Alistipes sp.]|nr:ATP-binding protein [Alistipes sp.]